MLTFALKREKKSRLESATNGSSASIPAACRCVGGEWLRALGGVDPASEFGGGQGAAVAEVLAAFDAAEEGGHLGHGEIEAGGFARQGFDLMCDPLPNK